MQGELCDYFNLFYQTVLREHIHDAIVHSEWLYFLSMLRSNALDKERIELYLGILASEKGKRDKKPREPEPLPVDGGKAWGEGKGKLMSSGQNESTFSEIKLEKRFSENWKPSPATLPSKVAKEVKVTPEPFVLRKATSIEDEPNRSLRSIEDESRSIRSKN